MPVPNFPKISLMLVAKRTTMEPEPGLTRSFCIRQIKLNKSLPVDKHVSHLPGTAFRHPRRKMCCDTVFPSGQGGLLTPD